MIHLWLNDPWIACQINCLSMNWAVNLIAWLADWLIKSINQSSLFTSIGPWFDWSIDWLIYRTTNFFINIFVQFSFRFILFFSVIAQPGHTSRCTEKTSACSWLIGLEYRGDRQTRDSIKSAVDEWKKGVRLQGMALQRNDPEGLYEVKFSLKSSETVRQGIVSGHENALCLSPTPPPQRISHHAHPHRQHSWFFYTSQIFFWIVQCSIYSKGLRMISSFFLPS